LSTRKSVTCKDTMVIQTHRIMPSHTNSFGNLFGGQLLYFLDNSASISMTRLTNTLGMTASIDNMNFLKPLPEGNSVCIESYVTGTGSTSLEVFAKIIGEDLITGERYLAATSFLTFVVQLDEHERKDFVMPKIVPETEEEKYICSGYERRKEERMKQRDQDKKMQSNLSLSLPWMDRS